MKKNKLNDRLKIKARISVGAVLNAKTMKKAPARNKYPRLINRKDLDLRWTDVISKLIE
jgi:hypothetical protein